MKDRVIRWLVIMWCMSCTCAMAVNLSMRHCDLVFVLAHNEHVIIHHVPVADSKIQKIQGLSGVHSVGVGMLFPFVSSPHVVSFWMKNTFVPLSIGFISPKGLLFQIEDMQPQTETSHASTQVAAYALELPQGDFQQRHLACGARLVKIIC